MSEQEPDVLARRTVAAVNRGELESLRQLVTADHVYEETGTGRRCEGADELIAALRDWRAACPDLTGEITGLVVDGGTVVLELTWRGTQTGPLRGPAADIPPTDRPFETRACLWQEWDGAAMRRQRHHLDLFTLLTQLGVVSAR